MLVLDLKILALPIKLLLPKSILAFCLFMTLFEQSKPILYNKSHLISR